MEVLRQGLKANGIDLDTKPFHSHISIGRVKRPLSQARLRTINQVRQDNQARDWGVMSIQGPVLYQSKLGPDGPEYITLEKFYDE